MSCSHPNIMYRYVYNIDTPVEFKSKWHFMGNKQKMVTQLDKARKTTPGRLGLKASSDGKKHIEYTYVACGQCTECRLEKSRQWAMRITMESKLYPEDTNWFVTLTYDENNLPDNASLRKSDLQEFLKRLRRHYEYHYQHQGIRFYAVGEYGTESGRPHYHIALFNTPIDFRKLKMHGKNEIGQPYFECKELSEIWGKGIVTIGMLSYESAGYIARYVMKKQTGKLEKFNYDMLGIIPEFSLMSRKPGIGERYYEQNKDKIYANDTVYIPKKGGSISSKPPKYFDKLYEREEPEAMEFVKSQRTYNSQMSDHIKYREDELPAQERRNIHTRQIESKVKKLTRAL